MEIRLLGLVEASHDGQALPLGGAKPRALLAMLALHANTPVSADRLIEGLWGERPPATAPKLVQVLVSQLRKQLAGSDAEIVTRGRGYELRLDPDAVDALRFERLLTSGENGSHVRRGARAVARPAARRPRRRAVRRAGDPAARGPLAAARARRRSTPRWPTGATRRCWARSTSWSASTRCASSCTASGCSRSTAAAARRRRWRRSATPARSCSTRSGSSRVRSCAASTTRSCVRIRSSTGRLRAGVPGRGAAAATGCCSRAAAVAVAAAVALAVTQLGAARTAGSTGSPRTRPA